MEKLEKLKKGDVLTAEYFGQLVDIVNAILALDADGSSLELVKKDSGWTLRFTGMGGTFAKTGGSGIPAMSGSTPGKASVTTYSLVDGSLVSDSITEDAYNLSSTAVGNNKWIKCDRVDGILFVDWEQCPA